MKTTSICRKYPIRTRKISSLFSSFIICTIFLLCCVFADRSSAFRLQMPPTRRNKQPSELNELRTKSHLSLSEYKSSSRPRGIRWRPRDYEPARAGVAAALILAIILGLSINDSSNIVQDKLAATAAANVMDAALPTTSTDLVAGALAESVGGICGAIATVSLTSLMNVLKNRNNTYDSTDSGLINAIAQSDYFIVNSASFPLLTLAGVSPELAAFGSALFAAIPSELLKIQKRRKDSKIEEGKLMDKLLEDERRRRNRQPSLMLPFARAREKREEKIALDSLRPEEASRSVDAVEIFADIIRWLEYTVLKTEFDGTLAMNGMVLGPGSSGAILGIVAAVSSQFYADVLYGELFEFGPKSKQEEVSSRLTSDWVRVYASSAISSAALFGIYEQSQIPVNRWIQGILAGGVDGCIGSTSFDLCLQTYINTNSPGPSTEAQFRALATNLVMLGTRLQDIAGDTTLDDFRRLFAAWSVSAYSYFQHM